MLEFYYFSAYFAAYFSAYFSVLIVIIGFDKLRKCEKNNTLIKENDQNIIVIAIGEKNDSMLKHQKIIQFGYVNDKTILKELYTLADAFILPSMAENFPNTIVESLLCGTPVIATNIGGIPEQITKENGLLVNLMDVEDWKQKLTWFIGNKQKFDRAAIKQKAKQDYNNQTIVDQHIKLYEQLLKANI